MNALDIAFISSKPKIKREKKRVFFSLGASLDVYPIFLYLFRLSIYCFGFYYPFISEYVPPQSKETLLLRCAYYTGYCLLFVVLLVLPLVLLLMNVHARKSCATAAACWCFGRVLTLGDGTFTYYM